MSQPFFLGMSTTELVEYIRTHGQDWYEGCSDWSACISLCCRAQVFDKYYKDAEGRVDHTAMLKDAAQQLGFGYNDLFCRKEN